MAQVQREVAFSIPTENELIRVWEKRIERLKNGIRNSTYPMNSKILWFLLAVTIALHFSDNERPFVLVNYILPWLPGYTIWWHLVACSSISLLLWLCLCFAMRCSIKLLFMYKGWMYESREKSQRISTSTRVWGALIAFFTDWNTPGLYSFQGLLPRLPLPSLHETMSRYLASVRPLLDDKSFDRMKMLATEFEQGVGSKLQWYLVLKSWWSSNYVSDWWEEYVYLCSRSALMINSNYYGNDAILLMKTNRQSARAAYWVYLYLRVRQSIERQDLQPIMVQRLIPLCSSQYERFFNTVRVPGIEMDRIVHYDDSNHIVVIHRGRYFKVSICCKGRILKPCEIQIQLEEILASKLKPLPGEELLASLTAWHRSKWAEARNTLFSEGINRESLHTIETAAFVLSLDDEAYETDIRKDADLDHYCKNLLHGTGHNRWFDKSFSLCVGTNGRVGLNAEHAWADGAVTAHIFENNIMDEVTENPYDESGNCKGTPELRPPSPQKMEWDLNNDACLTAINAAHEDAQKLLNDLQLRIYVHDDYGKSFMKTCRMSPDAYIQMALQLAYYRDVGHFSLTYEATVTRLFRKGRTETVRSCTIESAAWVKAMDDGQSTNKQRLALLQTACQRQQRGYQDAMCGKGIDRHLFCLNVVSKYLKIDSPFLNEVLSEPWRLTTSQTPRGQSSKADLNKYPEVVSCGGGFGPVADDGYAVSYIMASEDLIFFHISSKASCPSTDATRLGKQIKRALADMKHIFENV